MKPFVFIFRQSKLALTQEQMRQRSEEVRAWAIHLHDEGHKLEPHILGEECFVAVPGNGAAQSGSQGDSIGAILIVDFPGFEEAKKAAAGHPSLRYGLSVEVRQAFAPPGAPPLPAQ